jgi:hypothetical protein
MLYASATRAAEIPLSDLSRLQLKNVQAEPTVYRGMQALKLTEKDSASGEAFAMVNNPPFHNGTIDLEVSGAPSKTASEQARGFIGVVFRMQAGGSRFREHLYTSHQRTGRRPASPQPQHAVRLCSRLALGAAAQRKSRSVRIVCRYGRGRMDPLRIVVHGTNASLYVGAAMSLA